MLWMIACGFYNLGFGLFHLTFWRLLNWKEQLPRLSPNNRAVMQALNLCLTFFLLLGGYLYLAHPGEMGSSGIGTTLAAAMLLFWLFRTLLQVLLFDLRKRVHQALLLLFAMGVLLHGAAVLG